MRTFAEIGLRAVQAYGKERCSLFAASITYYALLSVFPLTLFAMAVVGFFLQDTADQQRLIDSALDNLPIDEASGRADLETLVQSIVSARGTLGVVGLIGAAYSGSALFGAVRASLNAALGIEKTRPFWRGKLLDVVLVFFFTSMFLLSFGVTFAIALAQRFSGEIVGAEAATWTSRLLALGYIFLPTAVSTLVFYLLYRFVPNRRLERRHALIGALFAAALLEALKILFAQYLTHFGNYNATYGTLGFVIAFLAFVNFGSQVMLIGVQVARASDELPERGSERFAATIALMAKLRALRGRIPFFGRPIAPALPPPPGDPLAESPVADSAPAVPVNAFRSRRRERSSWHAGVLLLLAGGLFGLLATARRH